MVAGDGIEPSTRGFSVRRRARFGARKPKIGDAFPPRRPNRPARPSLYRTRAESSGRARAAAHVGQLLARITTELFPNRAERGRAGPREPADLRACGAKVAQAVRGVLAAGAVGISVEPHSAARGV